MGENVWMCIAYASCDDCDIIYSDKNAMGLMSKHCKKYKHNGQVSIEYAIHYGDTKKAMEELKEVK